MLLLFQATLFWILLSFVRPGAAVKIAGIEFGVKNLSSQFGQLHYKRH